MLSTVSQAIYNSALPLYSLLVQSFKVSQFRAYVFCEWAYSPVYVHGFLDFQAHVGTYKAFYRHLISHILSFSISFFFLNAACYPPPQAATVVNN